ncbi:outer membrane lipid asymmetry maintenance protein MlaD [uncultured Mailhella sp.]|uniref:outer membrane lipid asymmetry maintenance protein MlaD n=1 Tax=uncultured Mailhella sp. TaxID=1981031 RepID=UPI00262981EC|nr:outer membrane lipid asymmetry maintenance protein MlaD [uncultured Mailhella sp.]
MSAAKTTVIGVFVLIGLICVSYLTIKLGRMEVLGDKGYTVSARFSSVAGLRVGASVEIAGVSVGKVSAIRLDTNDYTAYVDLHINEGVPISEDSMASVKTSGLIGDKYISITPGGAEETLRQGSVISDTEPALDLEALIGKVVFGGV